MSGAAMPFARFEFLAVDSLLDPATGERLVGLTVASEDGQFPLCFSAADATRLLCQLSEALSVLASHEEGDDD